MTGPDSRRLAPPTWSRILGGVLLAAGLVFIPLLATPSVAQQTIANVCTTEWGWCLLAPGTVIPTTMPCRCYTTTGRPVDGRTHSFDYSEVQRINPSPYLNPHAPAPVRPRVTR